MAVQGAIQRYNSISDPDVAAVTRAVSAFALSGFLGGKLRGGPYVQRLEELWANKFGVENAIACNSATSGLLAACVAAGVGPGDEVLVSPYTMSATAAAAKFLRANIRYGDVDPKTFCLAPSLFHLTKRTRAVIVTNLFGHPAELAWWRKAADTHGFILIEDNAQAPLAKENDRYAGTVGHIGVFSLNVHKHLQSGEGGVVVLRDHDLARLVRYFINHGEMVGHRVGLNLRMTEYTAALALSQLERIEELVGNRVEQAKKIIRAINGMARWLKMPETRVYCTHVYYMLPMLLDLPEMLNRESIVKALRDEGFPLEMGYVAPLYRLPALFDAMASCPVAEELHHKRLISFSNCEWSPTDQQIEQFAEAVYKVDTLMVLDAEKLNV